MARGPNIKDILHGRGLAPSKKRGQNFLVHRRTAERIVELAGVTAEDTVVELGVGFGALTIPLAERVRRVIGIELDAGIIQFHADNKVLPENVTLIHQDLLTVDFKALSEELGCRLRIMANLPYSITNPLLFKLVDNRDAIEWAVLMMQKEVGLRLTAPAGTKQYGVLTVLLDTCAAVEILMDVGPAQFHPRPKVDSIVARVRFHPLPERARHLPEHDHDLLRTIVNSAFQKRRKTLLNALASGGIRGCGKEEVLEILTRCGIAPEIRAERLTAADFVLLARAFAGQDGQT